MYDKSGVASIPKNEPDPFSHFDTTWLVTDRLTNGQTDTGL